MESRKLRMTDTNAKGNAVGIKEAKEFAQKLKDKFERICKENGTTKQTRKYLKALDEFIRCHQTNDAIYKKWDRME